MNNLEFSQLMETRTKTLAISIIKLSSHIAKTTESRVIRNQITKSGTSIGANYREANRSRSKADFYHKIKICETEASETVYWLELIKERKGKDMNWTKTNTFEIIYNEAKEILALFTSISSKLKHK